MDPFHGGGFPYNFFDYWYQWNPNPDPNYRLMNEPEILAVPPQDYDQNDYPSSNRQQMHQIYYGDVRYGNDGYHSPRHGDDYPYAPEVIPFNYNQETEYSSQRISVNIRLSRRGFIDNGLINGLEGQDLSCEVRGSVITVSGYPSDDGPNGFLALVQQISGDEEAVIVD